MRRRFTAEERARLLGEVRSGSPVAEVAKRHGLSPSMLYRWMQSPSKRAAPVFARLARADAVVDAVMMVHVGRAVVRVEKGFDAELLRDVVAALDGSR